MSDVTSWRPSGTEVLWHPIVVPPPVKSSANPAVNLDTSGAFTLSVLGRTFDPLCGVDATRAGARVRFHVRTRHPGPPGALLGVMVGTAPGLAHSAEPPDSRVVLLRQPTTPFFVRR
jgi:hypothetical protein